MQDKRTRILLIENSVFYTKFVQDMLSEAKSALFNYSLKTVDSLSAGLKITKRGGLDLILLDLTLPDSEGLDTFKSLYANAPTIPILILSAQGDEKLATRTVKMGAQDYLVKDLVTSELLKRSILYSIERKGTGLLKR